MRAPESALLTRTFWIVILWPRSTLALINIIAKNGKNPLIFNKDFTGAPLKTGFYLTEVNRRKFKAASLQLRKN